MFFGVHPVTRAAEVAVVAAVVSGSKRSDYERSTINTRNTMMRNQLTLVTLSAIALVSISTLLSIPESTNGQAIRPRQPKNLASQANKSCEKSILDTCVTTLMVFGRRDVYLPKNYQEMVPHCQEEFDAEYCIKNFASRCLTPFERQVAGMLILGAGQVLRKRCTQDGTKEYLTHYKCIKKTIPTLHNAMDQLIYTLMAISDEHNVDFKIPASCCSFARFQETANKIIRTGCEDFDKKAEEYIGTKMIKGYVSDILDLSCQGYESGNDKCSKIKIPNGGYEWKNNTFVKVPGAKLPPNKPNSVALPFLAIFTHL